MLNVLGQLEWPGPDRSRTGPRRKETVVSGQILSCEEIWVPGLLQPNSRHPTWPARTADAGGEGRRYYVINGQKVCGTSLAHMSDWMMLLWPHGSAARQATRASPTSCLRHRHAPGVTVKPLKQITSDSEFNEAASSTTCGHGRCWWARVNNGWAVGLTTLMFGAWRASSLQVRATHLAGVVSTSRAAWRRTAAWSRSDPGDAAEDRPALDRHRGAEVHGRPRDHQALARRDCPGPEASAGRDGLGRRRTRRCKSWPWRSRDPCSQLTRGSDRAVDGEPLAVRFPPVASAQPRSRAARRRSRRTSSASACWGCRRVKRTPPWISDFNQEQELLRNTARKFLENECTSEFVRARMAEPAGVTDAFWAKLAEQGWTGTRLSGRARRHRARLRRSDRAHGGDGPRPSCPGRSSHTAARRPDDPRGGLAAPAARSGCPRIAGGAAK